MAPRELHETSETDHPLTLHLREDPLHISRRSDRRKRQNPGNPCTDSGRNVLWDHCHHSRTAQAVADAAKLDTPAAVGATLAVALATALVKMNVESVNGGEIPVPTAISEMLWL